MALLLRASSHLENCLLSSAILLSSALPTCFCLLCTCVSDYSDPTEVKFEELKNVKLEEDEEEDEPEAAALDLSVNPAPVGGRLVFSGPKKKSSSSLGSSSSQDSVSSDSETSESVSCQGQEKTGVLTVHSYAREDGGTVTGEPSVKKKRSAPRSISEQELAEVEALCSGVGGLCWRRGLWGRKCYRRVGGWGRGSLCLILKLPPALVVSECQVRFPAFQFALH